jgi:hypothetical protein
MRTVVAVTAPVVAAGPNALTQSPTANAAAVAVCVSERVVVELVVILSFSVLTLGAAFVDFLDALLVGLNVWLSTVPVSEIVVPETAVTLPLAMVKFAPAKERPAPVPLRPPPGKLPRGGVPVPPEQPPAPNLPPAAPPPPNPEAHVPDAVGWLIVIERAATVVLDFFDGVPVTVRQSPAATALTVSVAVSENVVVGVQLTDVCPSAALWTSMVVPEIDATLPLAPAPVGADAAPAVVDRPRTADRQSAATVARALQCPTLRLLRGVRSIDVVLSLIIWVTYSLLSASIGARLAARLAG